MRPQNQQEADIPMLKKTEHKSRRDFLKLAGKAAPAAAIVAVTARSTTASAAQPVNLALNTIQDTAHTRAYRPS